MRRAAAVALLGALGLPAIARADDADDLRALAEVVLRANDPALERARAEVFPSEEGVGVAVSGEVPGALREALRDAILSALGARGGRVAAVPEGSPEALRDAAQSLGVQRVLHVTLSREGVALSARGEAIRARAGAWERLVSSAPDHPPWAGAESPLALSASLRARFGMPSRPPWPGSGIVRPRTIPTPFDAVVALAMGRVGGAPCVALAMPDRLRVARLEARTLSFLPQSWALSPLGALPSPPRQPLGAMRWDADGIHLRSSAQARAGLVRAQGDGLARALAPGEDLWPTAAGDLRADPRSASLAAPTDPAMRAAFPAARGTLRVDCDGLGACALRVDGAVIATLRDVAPPALIDDLDEDGAPEVVIASASAPDAADRVRVFSVRDGAVQERAGIPAPGPVLALSAGESPDGRALVVAARDLARGAVTLLVVP